MATQRSVTVCVVVSVLFLAAALRANELEFGRIVRQLDAHQFAARQAASEQLREAGRSAIPAVSEAAKSESREASTRAIEILKHHLELGDAPTQAAAKEALQQLAAGSHPAARRAKEALEPKPSLNATAQVFGAGRRIQLGAPVQFQIQAVAGNARRIQVRIANGVKDVEAEEDGRKIKIHEEPTGKIQIEVTEKKDGQEVTNKYEAANAAELKQQHPEAHKFYERYAQGQAGIRLGGGLRVPGPFGPVPPPQPAPAPVPQIPANGIEQSKQRLNELIERLQREAAQNPANAKVYRRMIESMERHKQHLDQIQRRLGQQEAQREGEQAKLQEDRERLKAELEQRRNQRDEEK